MVERIERDHAGPAPARGGPDPSRRVLTDTWLPVKRRHVRASTAYRYSWFVDRYINPAIGHVPLRRLRADHFSAAVSSHPQAVAPQAQSPAPTDCPAYIRLRRSPRVGLWSAGATNRTPFCPGLTDPSREARRRHASSCPAIATLDRLGARWRSATRPIIACPYLSGAARNRRYLERAPSDNERCFYVCQAVIGGCSRSRQTRRARERLMQRMASRSVLPSATRRAM
jgi:hypothetical protein